MTATSTMSSLLAHDPSPTTHGQGDRNEYYAKWDALAKEAVDEVDAEEQKQKKEADQKLGLNTDAPVSATQATDLDKRKQLKVAKKRWDDVELDREKLRATVSGLTSGTKTITVVHDLDKKERVLTLSQNSNATINLPAELDPLALIKVFIDDCQDCTINLSTSLVTSCVEIAHCTNVTLNVRNPCATVQVDLSDGVTVVYSQNVLQATHKVYHSAVRRLTIDRQVAQGGALKTQTTGLMDDFDLGDKHDTTKPADENQFITQLDTSDMLQTDLVLRDAGNHPTTAREITERKRELLAAMKEKGVDPNSEFGQKLLKAEDPMNPMSAAAMAKEKGNALFKQLDYGQAMLHYSEAILSLEAFDATESAGETKEMVADKQERSALLMSCLSNRSACALKLGQHANALKDASKCLVMNPKHVKSLFRKGLSLHALKRYHEACPILGKALELNPKNKQIKTALQFAERQLMMERKR